MVNSVMLVGRLSKEVETIKDEKGKESDCFVLAVPRAFKNENGEYDTDFFKIVLWNGLATNVREYCHKGDVVGVRGRLQNDENKNTLVIAEKVTFLSSKKPEAE